MKQFVIGMTLAAVIILGVMVTLDYLENVEVVGMSVEVVEEVIEEAPPPRQWSGYMQEWLQTNRLVIDYLNVKEKEWCAVAIQRIAPPDPEHPGAIPVEPTIDCIN